MVGSRGKQVSIQDSVSNKSMWVSEALLKSSNKYKNP